MNRDITQHTFSICAYKKSRYLEHCVKSLLDQTVSSNIIICTSTPNSWIKYVAQKYSIMLYVREGMSDIRDDWNFAYNMAKTSFVTVAHQDDIYNKYYVENFVNSVKKKGNDEFSIYITGYRPLKQNKVTLDINCIIRGLLRIPYMFPGLAGIKSIRRLPLAFGNCICCPTVTYNKSLIGESVFTSNLKFDIDWDTFLKLAKSDNPFLYNPKALVYYRIHDDATSKAFIDNNGRIDEDILMFNKFWPEKMTHLIMKFYTRAYDTYG